ncbi:TrlF family AAA-like ATPase [Mucilaginibacter sp. CAU 1740]|uniref:TrlF family AAA-like ATPase n=1 Tax=Mucilaginibacter sp. CAU 1740 TaxID=3140365 RepID=UPI00325A6A12
MNQYIKGATWRIWDLQIQTILDDRYESLSKYYTQFKQADPDKWQTYVDKVGGEANALLFDSKEYFGDARIAKKERCVNYVRNTFAFIDTYKPHLALIGITDHNYHDDTLIDEFINYSATSTCKVLSGVEINVGGIHVLAYFNNPPYGKGTFSEGIKTFLSKIDIDSPTTGGVLTLSNQSPMTVMDEILQSGGVFIFPHCNSNNGLFQERGKTDRTHLSNIFNYIPSIILQGNSKDSISKVAQYIDSQPLLFKSKTIYTTASDARCLKDFGSPDRDGHFLWIKADPTFEGFKQIIFEPFSRVRIDKEKPEVKNDYLVIDKVRFMGSSSSDAFPKNYIEINDKLNGIIGGKSSGKSILLYYIAKSIDPNQVQQKISDSKLEIDYDFEQDADFDFEVIWQDGASYKLKDASTEKSRQITYVPQMYINYLAEKGGQPELRKLIQGILEQKPEFKTLYDVQSKIIQENKITLTSELETFYQLDDEIEKNTTSIKSKGDKKARQNNVAQKTKEIDELRKQSGFTEEEELRYQELKSQQNVFTRRFTNLSALKSLYEKEYLTHLTNLKNSLGPSLNNIHINSIAKFLSNQFISGMISKDILADNKRINDVLDELIAKNSETIQRIDQWLTINEDRLSYYRNLLAPFISKIHNQEKLDELNEVILAEQLILDEIDELETEQKTLIDNKATAKQGFLKAYQRIYDSYKSIADMVNSNPSFSEISVDKGIVLSCKIGFDRRKLGDTALSLLNNQGYLSAKTGPYIDTDNNYIFKPAEHLKNLEDLFDKIQNYNANNIKFNRGGDVQTVSKKLFQDYFIIRYELSQNEESILKMSPGKKGMILLFLILHLSNAEYPILVDQPEDNLDNRTVYKELKEFIKEKKITRQIIIVTHNANLIVPTDAENIIIANQKGQDNSKDNEIYQFEYVTGSLENSFTNAEAIGILNQMGIKEHVCDILEGGEDAFKERELKYGLKKS